MNIGAIIKREREAQGLSQGELARRVGMAPPNLCRIESGDVDPRFSTVTSILGALGLVLRPQSSGVTMDIQRYGLTNPIGFDELLVALALPELEPTGAAVGRPNDILPIVVLAYSHGDGPISQSAHKRILVLE